MTPDVSELLERAKRLSDSDRAKLVDGVLATLDEPDPRMDEIWKVESERRVDGVVAGERPATAWDVGRKRLGL